MHTHSGTGDLILDVHIGLISLAYFVIAGQFYWSSRKLAGPAAVAAKQLVGIFVFCAICGYITKLVEMDHIYVLIFHFILLCFSWAYMISNQVGKIAHAAFIADQDVPHRNEILARKFEEIRARELRQLAIELASGVSISSAIKKVETLAKTKPVLDHIFMDSQ